MEGLEERGQPADAERPSFLCLVSSFDSHDGKSLGTLSHHNCLTAKGYQPLRAEDLLLQGSSEHHVDFVAVAGSSSNTKGAARKRRRHRWQELYGQDPEPDGRSNKLPSHAIPETVHGSSTRSSKRPVWGTPELAMGAAGIDDIAWEAANLRIAPESHGRNKAVRFLLHALRDAAFEMAKRYRWPLYVRLAKGEDESYLEDLYHLVLFEELYKAKFHGHPEQPVDPAKSRAEKMGVTVAEWERVLARPYAHLQQAFESWYRRAEGMIQRRIMGEEAPEDYVEERVKREARYTPRNVRR